MHRPDQLVEQPLIRRFAFPAASWDGTGGSRCCQPRNRAVTNSIRWEALRYFQFTDEPFVGILATLGLIGLLVSAAQGRLLPPAWLLAVALLNPRSINQSASVPMAMLLAVAVEAVLLPGIRAATAAGGGSAWTRRSWSWVDWRRMRSWPR